MGGVESDGNGDGMWARGGPGWGMGGWDIGGEDGNVGRGDGMEDGDASQDAAR